MLGVTERAWKKLFFVLHPSLITVITSVKKGVVNECGGLGKYCSCMRRGNPGSSSH